MAKQFLVPIDLTKLELQNAAIQNLASPPGSPVAGQIYYDTAKNQLGFYNGSAWVYLSDVSGLEWKSPVKANATTNQTLSGTPTIDGYATSATDRVLLTGQGTASQNGIWVVAAGAWSRPTDFAAGSTQQNAAVFVEGGSTWASTGWVLTGTAAITVDSTNETWVQFTGTGEITVTAPLVKTGNNLSISPLPPAKYATSIGNGSSTSYTVNHGLGTTDVHVQVFNNSTGAFVIADITVVDANNVSVAYAVAPSSNRDRVVVIG